MKRNQYFMPAFLSTGLIVVTFAPMGEVLDAKLLLSISERGLTKMFEDNLINLGGISWLTIFWGV